jgi:hypothetical protein
VHGSEVYTCVHLGIGRPIGRSARLRG